MKEPKSLEFTHITNAGEKCTIIVEKPDNNDVIIVLTEKGEYVRHSSDIKPIPQTKKIDMSKFAGTNIWLVHINNTEKRNQAKEFDKYPNIMREAYKPLFCVWNHWTGDSEPEWLEGFEYEVKYYHVCNDQRQSYYDTELWAEFDELYWKYVSAIRITGIKEGWEL